MRSQTPSPYRSQHPLPRPFPTRGIPGGWHDPWDGDPLDAVLAGLPWRDPNRRHMIAAGLDVELLAHARKDGRW
ncbi:MAG TPA: hypothetical protein VK356_14475, partial [Thermomicrobiales bacterium]|nr:hypothetical protein [Thermomicrobiales bacterium]